MCPERAWCQTNVYTFPKQVQMDWCEDNGITDVFGLTGTKALAAKVEPTGHLEIPLPHEAVS